MTRTGWPLEVGVEVRDTSNWWTEECPGCGGTRQARWTNLRAVAAWGDETLAVLETRPARALPTSSTTEDRAESDIELADLYDDTRNCALVERRDPDDGDDDGFIRATLLLHRTPHAGPSAEPSPEDELERLRRTIGAPER